MGLFVANASAVDAALGYDMTAISAALLQVNNIFVISGQPAIGSADDYTQIDPTCCGASNQNVLSARKTFLRSMSGLKANLTAAIAVIASQFDVVSRHRSTISAAVTQLRANIVGMPIKTSSSIGSIKTSIRDTFSCAGLGRSYDATVSALCSSAS